MISYSIFKNKSSITCVEREEKGRESYDEIKQFCQQKLKCGIKDL